MKQNMLNVYVRLTDRTSSENVTNVAEITCATPALGDWLIE